MKKRNSKINEFILTNGARPLCAKLGLKNNIMVSGDSLNTLCIWKILKERPMISLTNPISNNAIQSEVNCICFGIMEDEIYSGSNRGIINVWDINSQKLNAILKGHTINVSCINHFDSEDRKNIIISGSYDTTIKLWDLRSKDCITTYKGHSMEIKCLQVSPDGKWIVSGSQDSKVKIWEISTGKVLHTFEDHDSPVICAKYNPYDLTLATGSLDRTVKYFDLEKWNLLYTSKPEATGILALTFDENGQYLFSAAQESLKAWKVNSNNLQLVDNIESNWRGIQDIGISNSGDGEVLLGVTISPVCFGLWATPFKQINFGSPIPIENKGYSKAHSLDATKNRLLAEPKMVITSFNSTESDFLNMKKPQTSKANDFASPPTVSIFPQNASIVPNEKVQQDTNPELILPQEIPIKRPISHASSYKDSPKKSDQFSNNENMPYKLQTDGSEKSIDTMKQVDSSISVANKSSIIHFNNTNPNFELNYTALIDVDPESKRQTNIISDITKDHTKFRGVMATRINHLKPVLHWWNAGNMKSAINAISMMHITDPTVAIDLLNMVVSLNKGVQMSPEVGSVFLQKAGYLLESKINVHIRKGMEFVTMILKAFQDDIIAIKNVAVMNMVDIAREERIKKYDKLLDELEKIYNNESLKKRADKRKDDLGEAAVKLRSELELFLSKIKKMTQKE